MYVPISSCTLAEERKKELLFSIWPYVSDVLERAAADLDFDFKVHMADVILLSFHRPEEHIRPGSLSQPGCHQTLPWTVGHKVSTKLRTTCRQLVVIYSKPP